MAEDRQTYSIYRDEELMVFIRQGKVAAFDELYARYSRRLMVYFVRMMGFNRSLAEDALQDVFLKIVEKPNAFDPARPFKTWIFSVASNACKNHYRHREVVKRNEPMLTQPEHNGEDSFSHLAGKIDAGAFRETLRQVLESLPPEKKEAFLLRYQEDKSIAEVAEIQQCPEGSVKSRLHYTLKILEEKLRSFSPAR
jgi:RNA polymerase sigma-70 factor, ECF subfamily